MANQSVATNCPIDKGQAIAHLRSLGYQDGDFVFLRLFSKNKLEKGINRSEIMPDLDWSALEAYQAEGKSIYFVVNGGGHKDDEIKSGRAVFYEHDDLEREASKVLWQSLQLPEPTIQVDTSNRSVYSFWLLEEPCYPEAWKVLQTDLLEYANADRKLKNPSRVMRLAGCWHPEAGQVQIVSQSNSDYSYDMLRQAVPQIQLDSTDTQISMRWHTFEERCTVPLAESIPLELCLSHENRSLIARGVGEGVRNDRGFALAANLIGTANYLQALGQRFDDDPRSMFEAYCDCCHPTIEAAERETIWRSASQKSRSTSLPPDAIEGCIKGYAWRLYKEAVTRSQQRSVLELPDDDAAESLNNQKELLQELAYYSKDRLDLHKVYPNYLADALTQQALALPIAPECLHQVFMAVCAGIVGTRADIRVHQGWTEPCVLWTGFVGEPGFKKSPAMKVIRKPLVKLQVQAREEFEARKEEYEINKRQWDGKKREERAEADASEVPKQPNQRHYYLEDTTLDAAIALHAQEESATGFSLLYDELAELFDGLDQYKSGGKGNDRKKLLRLWNGGDLKTDRKTENASVFVPKSAVSLSGAIQTSVLEQQMGNKEDSDGMWGRILWSNPPYIRADHRSTPTDISALLEDVYTKLDHLASDRMFRLSPEAQKLFYKFESWVEDQREYCSAAFKNALAKMIGYSARIALLLHCLDIALGECPDDDRVPAKTMQRSLYLCQYYIQQVKLLHAKTIQTDLPPELLKIVELSQRIGEVSDREILRKRYAESAEDARDKIRQLIELGLGELSHGDKKSLRWKFVTEKVDLSHLSQVFDEFVTPYNTTGEGNTDEKTLFVTKNQNFSKPPDTVTEVNKVEEVLENKKISESVTELPQEYTGQALEGVTNVVTDVTNAAQPKPPPLVPVPTLKKGDLVAWLTPPVHFRRVNNEGVRIKGVMDGEAELDMFPRRVPLSELMLFSDYLQQQGETP
ncbi:MAG: DUF3987 domain-containing protein [Stenomitos rutilans HA7619-LM2]|jgi:hypothetical protein|nr:DUF3987 domain-containing protein [Stenomitos rutilans HA7619-LM2]MBW4469340.1 DUF3987 domain-containing protein [Stenomitos rutilans HA7619-LM2]